MHPQRHQGTGKECWQAGVEAVIGFLLDTENAQTVFSHSGQADQHSGQQPLQRPSGQHQYQKRSQQIELDFYRQRPSVQQRLLVVGRGKVITKTGKVVVAVEPGGLVQAFFINSQVLRQKQHCRK